MKVYCFFTEPASYTVDLINNIHQPLEIDYCFLKSNSEARTSVSLDDAVFLNSMSFLEKLKYIMSIKNKYDLIIFNSYDTLTFLFVFFLNIFSAKKNFIAIESDTQLIMPDSFFKKIFKRLYLSFLFNKNYVFGLAGGNYNHRDLFRYYGMLERNIFLMPMMVNNNKFYPEKIIKKEKFTFLFVGRLIKRKNVEALIKQFLLHFTNKNVILKIIGDGDMYQYFFDKYSSDQVHITGKLFDRDLIKEFQQASVFVCPSYFEPWGLVVNEALSAALPVIARKEVGAVWDLIQNKDTGFIVDSDKQMGKKMLSLFNDSSLLALYSNNAVTLMSNEWNYKLYKKCFLEFIKFIDNENKIKV